IGLHLSQRTSATARAIGHGLVRAMPVLLQSLANIGVAAMVWVGGGIILHGLAAFGLGAVPHTVEHLAEAAAHAAPFGRGVVEWLIGAIASAILGLLVGSVIVGALHLWHARKRAAH
ncbi:MAG: DUF808 family protein, partial [Sphingomonadales bacterium]